MFVSVGSCSCSLSLQVTTYHAGVIAKHVKGIAKLSPDCREPQHGIHALRIACDSRSAKVLDKLAHAHQLASRAECLLGGLKGRDTGLRAVGTVQVPGEEAGEILQCAQYFVAADWGVLVRLAGLWVTGEVIVEGGVPVVATNLRYCDTVGW